VIEARTDRGEPELEIFEGLRRLGAEVAQAAGELPSGVMPSWPAR
jgi:hypothetical protein